MRDLINQRKIWIFMRSVSAINGLICFGLSSTYKMLFGKWGFSGLVVYLFVNLIMWCLILWGKRIGISERFQGPVKALIFVGICSISVLLDKLVPGKSDAWSIISYASFALMSLFTSTKSELGFETGFFSFFLSLFVEQLCKTNLKLSPIAVVFCLLVLIFRHYSASGVQSGSIAPNGYHHVEVGPPDADVTNSGDDDERHASPPMVDVPEQSPLPADNQQDNQEEPSQASRVNGFRLSLRESRDQDPVPSGNNHVTIQIGETHPVPELRRRRRRWMPPGIPNISSRVGHTLGQLQRHSAPRLFFFFSP